MRNRLATALLLALLLTLPALGLAQTDCADLRQTTLDAPVDDIRSLMLGRMVAQGCLGGASDDWPLARTLDERLASAGHHADAAADVAADIRRRAQRAVPEASTADIADAFQATAARLTELTRALRNAELDTELTDAISWQTEGDLTVPALPEVDLRATFIATPCQQDQAACRAGLNDAMVLLRLVHAASRTVENATTRASELQLSVQLRQNDQRWSAYFTEARTQFPHELWLNSTLYAARSDRYCDTPGGFCTPPAHQWILLHPSIALEVVPDSPAGSRVEPALVLELVGYNRWRWDGPAMAPGSSIGASVVTIASDRADTDPISFGVMLHYNHNWSLGLARRNDTTGVILSYQLWNRSDAGVSALRERFTGQ